MKRKTSATVIMYAVLVFFFVIWIFPIYTAITKSLQRAAGTATCP